MHNTCLMCGVVVKSSFHALVICNHAATIWDLMPRVWPLRGRELLIDTCQEWLLNLLARWNDIVQDIIIMLIWRIWSIGTYFVHGKDAPPPKISVDFLESYLTSLWLPRLYTTEKIIKGKMSCEDLIHSSVISTFL